MASSKAAGGADDAVVHARPTLTVQMPSYTADVQSTNDGDGHEKGKLDPDHLAPDAINYSPGARESREVANRLNDDLELLRAERVVSHQRHGGGSRRSADRSHHEGVEDAFNAGPSHGPATVAQSQQSTWLTKSWRYLKKFPRVLRYVLYAIPPGVLVLIPVFLDLFAYDRQTDPVGGDGGVELLWFGIWLEVIWLSLWGARIITAIMPASFAFIADTVGSSNYKKWKDIGRQLEFPTALFLWMLAALVSHKPILQNHRDIGDPEDDSGGSPVPEVQWVDIVYKIITAFFVLATLNLVEKILIQWIATSFHLRTYSHRIRENQMHIGFLVDLYSYAKTRLEAQDPAWEVPRASIYKSNAASKPIRTIQDNARQAWSRIGSATSRVAGDLTGRKILKTNHPRKVVMELLRNTQSSYTLARVFYRTFVQPEQSTITVEDVQAAFHSQEEAETCFSVFDKDLNGDISMEELEMVCNEIHLEKKAIAASLKDLDSVIKKLDEVFMFIIVVIVIIIFISIISGSAAAALTSTGTVILGLSWLLQATAQEFLQSIIFVFVKHPFDVGDRVTVYGNTGDMMKGDDYYVVEVSLLYTEFKKMQGHVVQAPNSLLNTLFILNQRRSQGLADPVNLKLAFGTSEQQIEELKERMLDFCIQNKRDYAPRIISEVQTIDSVMSITMNIIFFHKSNYQNELLRLSRHNKFAVELMRCMGEMGMRGPAECVPGGGRGMPVWWAPVGPPPGYSKVPVGGAAAPVQRKRSNSRAAVIEAGMDFQDVYSDRRTRGGDSSVMSASGMGARLTSPREEDEEGEVGGGQVTVEEQMEKDEGGSNLSRVSVESRRTGTGTGGGGGSRKWSSALGRSLSIRGYGGGHHWQGNQGQQGGSNV
ncbi:Mechanosensitive ion channel-domain-containing protein [Cladorrhinum samala]|uniref:Mechanosensitive ion channel-domain-containing protein n=1 Tax=Cladorrhinum samala TaxID=585594 RepID=A0AAV9HLB9_9PEZI|nr:Mechanosensitive ion channel-domain-containing protein [Cladorrhinum samala]